MEGKRNTERFVFCTIITGNYFPFARALYASLSAIDPNVELIVLFSDDRNRRLDWKLDGEGDNIRLMSFESLCESGDGKRIYEKYHSSYHDAFRWAMKPVLLLHLLTEFQKVVYVDSDIHFYSDFSFLFRLLDHKSVVLSPHFRALDPVVDQDNYIMHFNNGIYNGGFVGASRPAGPSLSWWAHVCSQICEVNPSKGQFVDQSHLNLLPVYFDDVYVLKHRGCNVANWNQVECKRERVNETVLINGQYPIIFVHFTKSTVRGILTGSDSLLKPYLEIYLRRLQQYGVALDRIIPSSGKIPMYKKLCREYLGKYLRRRLRDLKNKIRMTG